MTERSRTSGGSRWAAAGILVLLLELTTAQAWAHAYIVGTQPSANGSYEDAGGAVAISFDEPVDVLDSNAIEVVDAAGNRVDRRDAAVDPRDATRVVVHVPPALKRGVYVVRWRVVSADTHVVHGAYSIGIGVAATLLAPDAASPFDPSTPLATALRTLTLLAALVLAGAAFLRVLMFDKLSAEFAGGAALTRRTVLAASLTVLVAAIPSLLVQAAAAGGALGSDVGPTLLHSTWGVAFLVRVLCTAALLIAALFAWRASRFTTIVASLGLLATFCFSGHAIAASGAGRVATVAFDFAHLVAAAAWIGGIFVLLAALIGSARRFEKAKLRLFALLLFANFTPIAMASVCVILATGIYASIVHVGSLADLFGTLYGRLVVAKIALFVALLAFGYRHMKLASADRTDSGRKTLVYEALIGLAVVGITGVLIGRMPPGGAHMPAGMHMSADTTTGHRLPFMKGR